MYTGIEHTHIEQTPPTFAAFLAWGFPCMLKSPTWQGVTCTNIKYLPAASTKTLTETHRLCLCWVITRRLSEWCVNSDKYTVKGSQRADQGGESPRLVSGYMVQEIPLRLERRWWCCHVSNISTMQVQVGTLLVLICWTRRKLVKFLLCSSTLLFGILCFLWSSKLGWYWSQTDWIWITSTQ